MKLSDIIGAPSDFFEKIGELFDKEIDRLNDKTDSEGTSVLRDYLAVLMSFCVVSAMGASICFYPYKRLGQSLDGDYLHCRD